MLTCSGALTGKISMVYLLSRNLHRNFRICSIKNRYRKACRLERSVFKWMQIISGFNVYKPCSPPCIPARREQESVVILKCWKDNAMRTEHGKISFIIISGGKRQESLIRLITSIQEQNIPDYETLVIGLMEQGSASSDDWYRGGIASLHLCPCIGVKGKENGGAWLSTT